MTAALQDKEEGEQKDQFEDGGVGKRGEQNEDEDE